MKSILLDEKLLGLVEMTSGLVNASFSLLEWQAVKMIFFAPSAVTAQILNRSLLTSVFLSAWKGSSEFVPTLQRRSRQRS